MLIEGGADNCVVGEPVIVAFNGGAGVAITGNGVSNVVTGASIFGNTGLNIDLGNDGASANDTCDVDSGPNRTQNKPVLSQITTDTGILHVLGSLETEASQHTFINWYTSPTCNPANPAAVRAIGESTQVVSTGPCANNFDTALTSFTLNREQGDDYLVGITRGTFPSPEAGTSEISNCLALPQMISPGVNLRMDKTAAPDPAIQGSPIVYTLLVANNGLTTGQSVKGLFADSSGSSCGELMRKSLA